MRLLRLVLPFAIAAGTVALPASAEEPIRVIACGPLGDLQLWTGPALGADSKPHWQAGLTLDFRPGLHCRRVGPEGPEPRPAGLCYHGELSAGGRTGGLVIGACYEALVTRRWRLAARGGGALTWRGATGLPLSIELRHRPPSPAGEGLWLGARWLSFPARGNPDAHSMLITISQSFR